MVLEAFSAAGRYSFLCSHDVMSIYLVFYFSDDASHVFENTFKRFS